MDAMRLSVRLWRILFLSLKSAIFTSTTVNEACDLVSSPKWIPSTLDKIYVRRACWLLHALNCSKFRRALHKMSCMTGRLPALSCNNRNASSKAAASEHPSMQITTHATKQNNLQCDLSRMNNGVFLVPLSRHTKTRQASTLNSIWTRP
ncbi:hypothetical protein TNCV_114931 [Trichonephila clavipes]|nr:hypothetical protein TNCV_114931 [Trichonephila clavipes]